MNDERWNRLAETFCRSTAMRPGDKVLLSITELEALPLLFAIYKKALELGAAHVVYRIVLDDLERHFLLNANDMQLTFFPEWELDQMKKIDVYIGIRARTNGLVFKGVPLERISKNRSVIDPIIDERVDNTRWCITRVPTDHDAAMAGMSTQDYTDFFFNATLQDYGSIKRFNSRLKALMERTDEVRITSPDGTDLTFSIKGIGVASCHGERNIPDGEVYTAPIKESVNGIINYNIPSIYEGKDWSNVSFMIERGKIVRASCDQGEGEIQKILDADEGSRYFGEFAIGTNPGITVPIKNSLFDEKILGSFHLTPGSAHKETDNGNNSLTHWDLVKVIRPEFGGGIIYFDNIPIMIDGKFVHPDLSGL
ncbi:MAG: aminopeptidase [Candidatus Pacebacteria bacterium]|nr:aminopeptidase [Candidatus Paceibacterota bacterium]